MKGKNNYRNDYTRVRAEEPLEVRNNYESVLGILHGKIAKSITSSKMSRGFCPDFVKSLRMIENAFKVEGFGVGADPSRGICCCFP